VGALNVGSATPPQNELSSGAEHQRLEAKPSAVFMAAVLPAPERLRAKLRLLQLTLPMAEKPVRNALKPVTKWQNYIIWSS